MKTRPILFQGAMVRALLADTKTKTRRLVKGEVEDVREGDWHAPRRLVHKPTCQRSFCENVDDELLACGGYELSRDGVAKLRSPHGKPGDHLWVRETWAGERAEQVGTGATRTQVVLDGGRLISGLLFAADSILKPERWKPSIFMPRWASRITLEVTGVRVERLNDISEADAVAEGIERVGVVHNGATPTWRDYADQTDRDTPNEWLSPRNSYRSLWQSINGAGSWAANPWVWVVEFKRVTP